LYLDRQELCPHAKLSFFLFRDQFFDGCKHKAYSPDEFHNVHLVLKKLSRPVKVNVLLAAPKTNAEAKLGQILLKVLLD